MIGSQEPRIRVCSRWTTAFVQTRRKKPSPRGYTFDWLPRGMGDRFAVRPSASLQPTSLKPGSRPAGRDRGEGREPFIIHGSEHRPLNPAILHTSNFIAICDPDDGLNAAISCLYSGVLGCSRSPQALPSRRQEALPSLKRSMSNRLMIGCATRLAIEKPATIGGREQKCAA